MTAAANWTALGSAFAVVVALIGAVLSYRAISRQTRNAERNTNLAEIKAVNEALREEVDRLTISDAECKRRLSEVEKGREEDRQLMRELQREHRTLKKAGTTE